MPPYGVLVHGAGWVATQHLSAYQANPHTNVLAVSSRSAESAREKALQADFPDAAIFTDLEQALAHPGIDMVSICTPQHVHCENVLACAAAGKHMVIEKPVANSRDELRKMLAAVRDAGVQTVVSFVLRWNPLFVTLKRMIASGDIGAPYCVEADYLSHNGAWWGGWNDARTVAGGVSAMLVAGCHAVDACRWFASPNEFEAARPVEITALRGGYRKGRTHAYNPITNTFEEDAPPMEYDGLEMALIRFENGAIGKVSVNADCVMPYRFPLRIFGDRGTVFDNRIWSHRFPGQTDWVELPTILPDSSDVSHHPFQGQIDHFLDCLQRGRRSHCDLEDAAITHELVYALADCYKSGSHCRLIEPQ